MPGIDRRTALTMFATLSSAMQFARGGVFGISTYYQTEVPSQITLEQFGGKSDGKFDCSGALEEAAATGIEIRLQRGKTYQIRIAKIINNDLRIVGGGILQFSVTTKTALLCTGSVYLEDTTLDGNFVTNELIRSTGYRFEMVGGSVKNVFNPEAKENTTGIQLIDCNYASFESVKFSSICGPSNRVVGDAAGAIAAIQISGHCNFCIIKNCNFTNVNNRNSVDGVSIFEDSDAIRCYSTTGSQHIEILGCTFNDIGKRAAKFLGTEDSHYLFERNVIISKYSNTTDDRISIGNGMHSVISCYGGYVIAKENRLVEGVACYFFEGGTSKLRSVVLVNNTYAPEFHKMVNTSVTRFFYIGNNLAPDIRVETQRNTVINTYGESVIFPGRIRNMSNQVNTLLIQ